MSSKLFRKPPAERNFFDFLKFKTSLINKGAMVGESALGSCRSLLIKIKYSATLWVEDDVIFLQALLLSSYLTLRVFGDFY
jgi:hypothetical protein